MKHRSDYGSRGASGARVDISSESIRLRSEVVQQPDVIGRIVEQNLGVYRASPSRLQEDVSQESQVASDYRGRLVYELLQNADDAMADSATTSDRVSFLVTDEELWIANTGRALTDDDVLGLCGLGASSKIDAGATDGRRSGTRDSVSNRCSRSPTSRPSTRDDIVHVGGTKRLAAGRGALG